MGVELSLALAFVALAGNAFFVDAEFSLVSARRSSIELRAAKGSRAAKITLAAMEQVSVSLAAAQLGITLCSLVFGALGEPVVAHLLEEPFAALGMSEFAQHAVAFTIAMALMIYVHVVIGEMVPKNLALADPVRWSLILVPVLFFIVKLTRPLIAFLNNIANMILRLFGVHQKDEIASSFSRDEVIGFVQESRREGLLNEGEERLLSGSLEFDSRTVEAIIVPVEQVVTAGLGATATDLEDLVRRTGYSRYPISGKDGTLKGYIHVKDLLGLEGDEKVAHGMRELPAVAPSDSARVVLRKMQRTGTHIAQVVNARHRVLGVVMLEDVLEQIVGTIHDGTQKRHS